MQDKNPKSLFGIYINEYTERVQFNIIATKIDFLYLRASGSANRIINKENFKQN